MSAWTTFAREFYLSCAYLSPKTMLGNRVSHSESHVLLSERDSLLRSIQALRGGQAFGEASKKPKIAPRDEPTWHAKPTILKLASELSLSNSSAIIVGLSYPTTFFDNLPSVRNFYAHRSADTAAKVERLALKDYGVTGLGHPTSFVNQILPQRSDTLLAEWLTDMQAVSAGLCQ